MRLRPDKRGTRRMGWVRLIVCVLAAVLCGSALSLSTAGSCNLARYIPLIHSSSMSSFTLISTCSMLFVQKCENSINTIQFNKYELFIGAKQLGQISYEKFVLKLMVFRWHKYALVTFNLFRYLFHHVLPKWIYKQFTYFYIYICNLNNGIL